MGNTSRGNTLFIIDVITPIVINRLYYTFLVLSYEKKNLIDVLTTLGNLVLVPSYA